MVTQAEIKDKLEQVTYPGFTKSIVDFEFVKNISIDDNSVNIELDIPSTDDGIEAQLQDEIQK
ncbi:MAG TPA: DUF59 domain-containing protein, partial [Sulfurovum sp.]|nr:DUF59 domain-containing protein [Sulfurovum sp.]